MSYPYPNLTTIYQQAIADATSSDLSGVTVLLPQSVIGVLCYVNSAAVYGCYQYLDYIALQCTPYTATGEYLDAWANLKGIFREAATYAIGTVSLTGTSGTAVSNGTLLQRADGFQYSTNSLVTLSGTSANIPITAITAGALGNAAGGIVLTLSSPIAGMRSSGSAYTNLTGGADQETDDSLRTRMLLAYQSPPQGGSITDYEEWALAVNGVTRAWAIRGPNAGEVVVYTMFDSTEAGSPNYGFPAGSNGGATNETRISAATGDLLAVANYIFPLQPATALVYSSAPIAHPINFTFSYLSPNTTAVQNGITSALQDLFIREGSPLGMTLQMSDIYSSVSSVPGILEFDISSPSTSTSISLGYLPTLGSITF